MHVKGKKSIQQRIIKPEDLDNLIKPGNRIFLSSGASTPVSTAKLLMASEHKNHRDLEFIQLAFMENVFSSTTSSQKKYRFKTFTVGEHISRAFTRGDVDFIPATLSELPYLIISGTVGIDVAIIQVSPPNRRGYLNLGTTNDLSKEAIQQASLVIGEINPNMPVTRGTTPIHHKNFDYYIKSSFPLVEFPIRDYDETMSRIGKHTAALIDNGSTLSLGAGRIFQAIVSELKEKKNLQIISHVLSDWIIELAESGALKRKGILNRQPPVKATSCIGSKKLYGFVDSNSSINFLQLLQSRHQKSLPALHKLVSVLNVNKIDISCDSVLVPSHDQQVAGFDGKMNFSIAATTSRDGKAIVVLTSQDKNGKSNIVVQHSNERGLIRSTLGSTRYVVTEYGIASVFGKTIRERVMAMAEIAHPNHREQLIEDARTEGFIYKDQIFNITNSQNYPGNFEAVKNFKKNLHVTFRPIRPSDEDAMRRLFYHSSDEAKDMRYFSPLRLMPHHEMQHYVNIDYINTIAMVGVIQQRGIEQIIAEGRFVLDPETGQHEIAFIVDDPYQGRGIASFLLDTLITIALQRNISELVAFVLPENHAMKSILKKARVYPEVIQRSNDHKYTFYLSEVGGLIHI